MAIKMLVTGMENSGKTTLISKITPPAFVLNADKKDFLFEIYHADMKKFTGLNPLKEAVISKLEAIKEKHGQYPNAFIVDTITKLYGMIEIYCSSKFTQNGYEKFTQKNQTTDLLDDFISETTSKFDIDLILVSHVQYDNNLKTYTIPASGAFGKAGGWLARVNEAIYINKANRTIFARSNEFPARTMLTNEELVEMGATNNRGEVYFEDENFDINKYIAKIKSRKSASDEFKI